MRPSRFVRGLLLALLVSAPLPALAGDTVVFAAASLTDALKEIGGAYKADTGNTATLSFAASSALARQIEASGGADVFISADNDWMDYLEKENLLKPGTRRTLLGNHLVLIAPKDAAVALAIAPHFDLVGALHGGKLSLADPDSVPAGKYARAALTQLGVWDAVMPQLARGENVRVALSYVSRGEAPLGIVYTTDALSDKAVRIVAEFPDSSHPPIVYPAALVKDARPEAQAFLDYLATPRAHGIFRTNGFVVLEGKP